MVNPRDIAGERKKKKKKKEKKKGSLVSFVRIKHTVFNNVMGQPLI